MKKPEADAFAKFLLDVIDNAVAKREMTLVETQSIPRADGHPQTVRIIVIPETVKFTWP